MRIHLSREGLYVTFRYATPDRHALGFVVKPTSQKCFSERHARYRSLQLGPLYFRTFSPYKLETQ